MKLTRLVPAAVAAVALLAGCSPTPGTALVVDGTRYTESQLDEIVEGCAEAMGLPLQQINRQGVVGTLLFGGLFDSLGTDVTEEQLKEYGAMQMPGSEQMFANDACAPLGSANIKLSMLNSLDPQLVLDAAPGVDVQLNPRYGKWEPDTAHLLDPSGSLSESSVALQ